MQSSGELQSAAAAESKLARFAAAAAAAAAGPPWPLVRTRPGRGEESFRALNEGRPPPDAAAAMQSTRDKISKLDEIPHNNSEARYRNVNLKFASTFASLTWRGPVLKFVPLVFNFSTSILEEALFRRSFSLPEGG